MHHLKNYAFWAPPPNTEICFLGHRLFISLSLYVCMYICMNAHMRCTYVCMCGFVVPDWLDRFYSVFCSLFARGRRPVNTKIPQLKGWETLQMSPNTQNGDFLKKIFWLNFNNVWRLSPWIIQRRCYLQKNMRVRGPNAKFRFCRNRPYRSVFSDIRSYQTFLSRIYHL